MLFLVIAFRGISGMVKQCLTFFLRCRTNTVRFLLIILTCGWGAFRFGKHCFTNLTLMDWDGSDVDICWMAGVFSTKKSIEGSFPFEVGRTHIAPKVPPAR